MALSDLSLSAAVEAMQTEIQIVSGVMKDKGLKRFLRPLLIAAVLVYGCYAFLYVPAGRKLAGLRKKVDAAKATAQHADAFKTLQARLTEVYAQLPAVKDKNDWLTQTVLESMRAENILSDSLAPPNELDQSGFLFQRMSVTVHVRFSEMMSWLARLEANKPFVHIASVDVNKTGNEIGRNMVTCELTTIVPARKLVP